MIWKLSHWFAGVRDAGWGTADTTLILSLISKLEEPWSPLTFKIYSTTSAQMARCTPELGAGVSAKEGYDRCTGASLGNTHGQPGAREDQYAAGSVSLYWSLEKSVK